MTEPLEKKIKSELSGTDSSKTKVCDASCTPNVAPDYLPIKFWFDKTAELSLPIFWFSRDANMALPLVCKYDRLKSQGLVTVSFEEWQKDIPNGLNAIEDLFQYF